MDGNVDSIHVNIKKEWKKYAWKISYIQKCIKCHLYLCKRFETSCTFICREYNFSFDIHTASPHNVYHVSYWKQQCCINATPNTVWNTCSHSKKYSANHFFYFISKTMTFVLKILASLKNWSKFHDKYLCSTVHTVAFDFKVQKTRKLSKKIGLSIQKITFSSKIYGFNNFSNSDLKLFNDVLFKTN